MTRRRQQGAMGLVLALMLATGLTMPVPGASVAYAIELSGTEADADNATPPGGDPRGETATIDKDGKPIKCKDIPEAAGGKIIGKIVPCIVRTVETSTQRFSQKMVDWLRPLLYTFLTLVVVLFGVRVLSGEPEIHKQGILLALKITLVVTILNMIPGTIVPAVYQIMKESQAIVVGAINTSSIGCDISHFGDDKTLPVWALMDCITGKLFGFTAVGGNGNPSMLLSASFLGLLSGFLFGGTWGVVVFFGMLGVLFSMFMLIVRVVSSFLNGYLIACLMLILSPLLMPLIFMKSTAQYFEGVWKNILTAFTLPILVTAYAMLALMLYDKMLFAEDSMLKNIFKYANVERALTPAQQACNRQIGYDIDARVLPGENFMTRLQTIAKDIFMQNATAVGTNDPCNLTTHYKAEIDKIKDDHAQGGKSRFDQGKTTFDLLFAELAALFILGFLINAGMKQLMSLIRTLSLGSTAVQAFSGVLQQESKFEYAIKQSSRQAASTMKDYEGKERTGGDFVTALPGAVRYGMEAFYGVIKKS